MKQPPKSLREMLDALAAKAGSDRKAAPLLGISQVGVSAWRTGRAFPDDDKARRIAELLQLDAAYVLAIIHGERAKTPATRDTWRRIAAQFKDAAVVAALALGAASFGMPAPAHGAFNKTLIAESAAEYALRRKQRRQVLGVRL